MPTSPIDHSSLIFPSASTSITSTLTQLKRSNLSISNRLRSIAADAAFVERIADDLGLPLIANERCGSWYIPASRKAGSAYFKSTDGHHGQWAFSLRRLNLQVLDVIEKEGSRGCIIVDSTRKGKSMPDALSKTVPIWTCVLNRLLFPEDDSAGELRTPGHVVSRSEHERIEERVLQCVQEARSLELDLGGMRARLGGKPMLLVWITPDSSLPRHAPERADRNLVVLCTASSRLSSNGALEAAYVQGAADDSESWALGLDAATFWVFRERLLSTAEDELPDVIRQVVSQVRDQQAGIRVPVLVRPTSNIWIGDNTTTKDRLEEFDLVVSCSEEPAGETAIRFKDLYLNLACSSGKVGSRQLRAQLPRLAQLRKAMTPTSKLLVTCHSGRDLSVGVALAIICLFYDDNGMFAADDINSTLAKPLIKHRLSWIMVSMPDATPSRATLQSVNAFLLG